MNSDLRTKIRWMVEADLNEVMAIERAAFSHPWTEEEFHRIRDAKSSIAKVCDVQDFGVAGYLCYSCGTTSFELLNLAVGTDCRRRGVAAMLVEHVKETLAKAPQKRNRIAANVSEYNLPAQLFFQAQGFLCMRIEHELYGPGHDAYRFVYRVEVPKSSGSVSGCATISYPGKCR